MNRGSLVNARVGTALHPQSVSAAGGMTYRPAHPVGVEQRPARLSHTQEVVGSTPTPATEEQWCPFLNKRGGDCGSEPLPETGICREHSKKAALVVAGLLGR